MEKLFHEYDAKTGRFIQDHIKNISPKMVMNETEDDFAMVSFTMPKNWTDVPIPRGISVPTFKPKEKQWVEGVPMPDFDPEIQQARWDDKIDGWVIDDIADIKIAELKKQLHEVILDEMAEAKIAGESNMHITMATHAFAVEDVASQNPKEMQIIEQIRHLRQKTKKGKVSR